MEKETIVALFCGILALVLALSALLPISYNELENLPDFSGYANKTDIPQSFPYENITGIPNIDLQHGLYLWLPFDGVSLDKSGYCLDSVLEGGASYSAGKYAECLSLDGIDSYAIIQDDALLNSSISTNRVTVAFWMRIHEFKGGWVCAIDCKSYAFFGGVNQITILDFQMNGSLQRLWLQEANRPIADGISRFYMWSWDGEMVRYYCNNELKETMNCSGMTLDNIINPLYIGRATWFGNTLKADIDDVRFYNRVLSDSERFILFNLGV